MRLLIMTMMVSLILTECPTDSGGDEVPQVRLITNAEPPEGGSTSPDTAEVDSGSTVNAIADPADGWQFDEWSGDTSSTENPLALTLTTDTRVTANFSEVQNPQATLIASASPSEGGSVSPSSTTVDSGSTVSVQADPADGWQFQEWTGDRTGTANPLSVTLTEDTTSITANFLETAKAFTDTVNVSDGANGQDLIFGLADGATDGFDDGVDREAPPPPPSGSFDAVLKIPDFRLFDDFRGVQQTSQWQLNFAREEGQSTITLTWEIPAEAVAGQLVLTDDPSDPGFEKDMFENSSHEVTDSSVNTLFIVLQ